MNYREKRIARRYFALGVMCQAILVTIAILILLPDDKPTRAELQREFDGYRMCMQAAGKNRCSMQPLDFVRYVEVKHLLSIRTEIIDRRKQTAPERQSK